MKRRKSKKRSYCSAAAAERTKKLQVANVQFKKTKTLKEKLNMYKLMRTMRLRTRMRMRIRRG